MQADLEHDRGHSLYSGCSLINGNRGITITYPLAHTDILKGTVHLLGWWLFRGGGLWTMFCPAVKTIKKWGTQEEEKHKG